MFTFFSFFFSKCIAFNFLLCYYIDVERIGKRFSRREGKKMKKKRNLKKKVLGVSLSALLVCLPFMTSKIETVKADTCHDHVSYYVFLDSVPTDYVDNGERVHNTTSVFPAVYPDGTDFTTVDGGWLSKTDRDGYWTDDKIADDIVKAWTTRIESSEPFEIDDTHWVYYHSKHWADLDGGNVTDQNVDSSNVSKSTILSSLFWSEVTHNLSEIKNSIPQTATNSTGLVGSIKRTYNNTADWQTVKAAVEGLGTNRIYSPAIYKATFKVCNGGGTTSTKHKVTIKYVDEDMKSIGKSDYLLGSYAANESYSYTCPAVNNYTQTGSTSISGTMGNSDKVEYCYYKNGGSKNSYTLTTKYIDKDGKELLDPVMKTYDAGSTVDASCKDNFTSNGTSYVFSSWNTYSASGAPTSLKGIVMNDDVVVNCVYSSKSSQTSDIPIFIVWGLG